MCDVPQICSIFILLTALLAKIGSSSQSVQQPVFQLYKALNMTLPLVTLCYPDVLCLIYTRPLTGIIDSNQTFIISPITPNISFKFFFAIQVFSVHMVYNNDLRQYSCVFTDGIDFIKNCLIHFIDGNQICLRDFILIIAFWEIHLAWLVKKHNQRHW